MPCIQLFCCNRVPKSTKTDYYIDPKILTRGEPKFIPAKIDNKISELEFQDMRKEIFHAGGADLKRAMLIYKILLVYVVICFMIWVGQAIFAAVDTEKIKEHKIPFIVVFCCTAVPNITLDCKWKAAMKRACKNINQLFEQKNQEVYSKRGVQWLMHNTLVYVHLKLVDPGVKTIELEIIEDAKVKKSDLDPEVKI